MDQGSDQSTGNEEHIDSEIEDFPGIQPALRPQTLAGGVYFVLERASLCVANVGKVYSLTIFFGNYF